MEGNEFIRNRSVENAILHPVTNSWFNSLDADVLDDGQIRVAACMRGALGVEPQQVVWI